MLRLGPVVLYFYPRDFAYLCTKEACAFREEHEALSIAGASLCGVSMDDRKTHIRFSEDHDIPFPLLADPRGEVVDAYGARSLLGIIAKRVTYVIDRDRRIASVHHHEMSVKKHLAGVAKALGSLGLNVEHAAVQ